MEYVMLGRTGRRVSRLGFGGALAGLKNYLGVYDPNQSDDRDQVIAAVRRAVELGVSYFDTAPGYGEGASERIFGEALKGEQNVFVATKVSLWEKVDIQRSLEASLKNLQRHSVDLLQFHGTAWSDEEMQAILRPGGYLDQVEKCRAQGLVRHIGFTVEIPNESMFALLKSGRFDVLQVMYNLLFQHPYEPSRKKGLLYDAHERGMGIVTMRTATSGMFQRWVQLVNRQNSFDYTPALMQFVLSNPLVNVALVGMRTAREVEQNVKTCEDMGKRIDLDELFGRYV